MNINKKNWRNILISLLSEQFTYSCAFENFKKELESKKQTNVDAKILTKAAKVTKSRVRGTFLNKGVLESKGYFLNYEFSEIVLLLSSIYREILYNYSSIL